ncbi:efflux RND transporter permease subunit, partial [Acinetobacter baumannii]
MGLAELCVRRPVLATVLNLLVMLAGVMAFERLTVREYPNIDMPVVTVQTDYRGASAAIVESTVTKTLEDSLSG